MREVLLITDSDELEFNTWGIATYTHSQSKVYYLFSYLQMNNSISYCIFHITMQNYSPHLTQTGYLLENL